MEEKQKPEEAKEQTTIRLPAEMKEELQQEAEEQQQEMVTRLRKPWFDRLLDKYPYLPTVISCVSLLISLILFLVALLLRS